MPNGGGRPEDKKSMESDLKRERMRDRMHRTGAPGLVPTTGLADLPALLHGGIDGLRKSVD